MTSRAHDLAAAHVAVWLAAQMPILHAAKAEATIDDMLAGYDDDLGTLVQELLRGGKRTSKAEFRRTMKSLIKAYGREGLTVAWVEGGGDVEDIQADEVGAMQAWVTEQQSHVNDFADWLTAKDSDLDAVPGRVAMWVSAYGSFLREMHALAMGDPVGEWEYGDTEHCDTCLELNGQRHRLSWYRKRDYIPQRPGAAMDCGGYRCQCIVKRPKTGERLL